MNALLLEQNPVVLLGVAAFLLTSRLGARVQGFYAKIALRNNNNQSTQALCSWAHVGYLCFLNECVGDISKRATSWEGSFV